jgi:glycosyltransferase involved in cell wall biosynthesis
LLILKARRVAPVPFAIFFIRRWIREHNNDKSGAGSFAVTCERVDMQRLRRRLIVLKAPVIEDGAVVEKGVLLLKFTETFSAFYDHFDVRAVTRAFYVVLEPSWAGYSLEEMLAWTSHDFGPIVVMCPWADDYDFIKQLKSNLVPVRVGASDWADPDTFYPVGGVVKEYDALYVANYSPGKRVDRFIEASARVWKRNPKFRSALVCARLGSARSHIEALAAMRGASRFMEIYNNVSASKLNILYNSTKVNVLLSYREGANKTLFEGMFSDTPALVLDENVGVNRAHINARTGIVVSDRKLEQALFDISTGGLDIRPRQWAMRNIAPVVSTERLEGALRRIAAMENLEWQRGIMPKTNTPELTYVGQRSNYLIKVEEALLHSFTASAENAYDDAGRIRALEAIIPRHLCEGKAPEKKRGLNRSYPNSLVD